MKTVCVVELPSKTALEQRPAAGPAAATATAPLSAAQPAALPEGPNDAPPPGFLAAVTQRVLILPVEPVSERPVYAEVDVVQYGEAATRALERLPDCCFAERGSVDTTVEIGLANARRTVQEAVEMVAAPVWEDWSPAARARRWLFAGKPRLNL